MSRNKDKHREKFKEKLLSLFFFLSKRMNCTQKSYNETTLAGKDSCLTSWQLHYNTSTFMCFLFKVQFSLGLSLPPGSQKTEMTKLMENEEIKGQAEKDREKERVACKGKDYKIKDLGWRIHIPH